MYPENYDFNSYQQQQQPPRRSKKPIVIMIAVFAVLMIGLISWAALRSASSGQGASDNSDSISDPGYKLTATSLKDSSNFSALQGNDLYAYNGMAFYKQSLDGGQTTVLSKGVKLPHVSNLTWVGNSGALLTFDSSFLGTGVYDAIKAQGQVINATTQGYVWYFDFASSSLSLVGKSALAVNSVAIPASGKGFFFAGPVQMDSSRNTTIPLSYFDIAARKSAVISQNLGVSEVTSLSMCASGQKICLVGRDSSSSTHTKLYSVDTKGAKQVAADVNGRIIGTSSPDRYITLDNGSDDKPAYSQQPTDGSKSGTTDTDNPDVAAKLFTLSSNTTSDLGFKVGLSNVYASFKDDGSFIALDNSYNANEPQSISVKDFAPAYRAGQLAEGSTAKSKLFPIQFANKNPYSDTTIKASFGTDAALITGTSQFQFLMSKLQTPPKLTAVDQSTAAKNVDACLPSAGKGAIKTFDATKSTFDIMVTYDSSFARNINAFSSCLTGKGADALIGYNYTFSGADPTNGRYVTD